MMDLIHNIDKPSTAVLSAHTLLHIYQWVGNNDNDVNNEAEVNESFL